MLLPLRLRTRWALLAAVALAPAVAGAVPRKPKPKAEAKLDTRPLLEKLGSGDPDRVSAALVDTRAAGTRAAALAPAVESLLAKGLSRALVGPAIDALAALEQPSSSGVLRGYLSHRVPDVRRSAARALGSTKGPEAAAALKEGLRSPDPEVRGLAAVGLGKLGSTEALPDLFLALDRGVPLAAPAIGALCKEAQCDKLLDRFGKLGFDVVIAGVDVIARRAFPDDYVIKVLLRVRDLGSPEAKSWLKKLDAGWPPSGSKRVKKELEALVPTIVVPS